jgi:hypothetical protein
MQPFQNSRALNVPHLRTASLPQHATTSETALSSYSVHRVSSQDENFWSGRPYTYSNEASSDPSFSGYDNTYSITPSSYDYLLTLSEPRPSQFYNWGDEASSSLSLGGYNNARPSTPPFSYNSLPALSLPQLSQSQNRMSIMALVDSSPTHEPALSMPIPNAAPLIAGSQSYLKTNSLPLEQSVRSTRVTASAWAVQNPLQPTFPARSCLSKNASQSAAAKAQRAVTAAQNRAQRELRDQEIEKIQRDLEAAIEAAASRLGTSSLLAFFTGSWPNNFVTGYKPEHVRNLVLACSRYITPRRANLENAKVHYLTKLLNEGALLFL